MIFGDQAGLTTDIHFTMLHFTPGIGVPVMCVVIFKSEKHIRHIPTHLKAGIDICKLSSSDKPILNVVDEEMEGSAIGGDPNCYYNGIQISCFLGASANAAITSELLTKCLEYMDNLNII
jgi:hypothetical protein